MLTTPLCRLAQVLCPTPPRFSGNAVTYALTTVSLMQVHYCPYWILAQRRQTRRLANFLLPKWILRMMQELLMLHRQDYKLTDSKFLQVILFVARCPPSI
jgi:hypothetical protein